MQMRNRLCCLLAVLMLGWFLMPSSSAAPAKVHKSKKDAEQGAGLTAFDAIPTLSQEPDKDCYATVSRKNYDVRISAKNLIFYIYPKDKGERIDKPIEINSFCIDTNKYKPTLIFDGVRDLAAPLTNATKLVITAVGDRNKIVLTQTWKFGDNKLDLEETVTGVPVDKDKPQNTPLMRTVIHWPMTHKFAPNVEKTEREQAVTGYSFRWHAGKSHLALKTITVPYASAVTGQNAGDWVENQGPWGARKVTIRRKPAMGNIVMGNNLDPSPYCGVEMQYAPQFNAKLKKVEAQGLEIKID